jgi:uncharacterized protein YlxW (UPF0749 family)
MSEFKPEKTKTLSEEIEELRSLGKLRDKIQSRLKSYEKFINSLREKEEEKSDEGTKA